MVYSWFFCGLFVDGGSGPAIGMGFPRNTDLIYGELSGWGGEGGSPPLEDPFIFIYIYIYSIYSYIFLFRV